MRLTELEHVWILRAGSAELFVVQGDSRRPLGLVEAPGCLPGTGESDISVEAKLSDDAEVEPVSFNRLVDEPELRQLALIEAHVLLSGFSQIEADFAAPESLAELREWQKNFAQSLKDGFVALDQAELDRQQSRARQSASAVQRASNRLASVLLSDSRETLVHHGDPLVSAMRVVGSVLGIAIEPHPSADSFPTLLLRIQATARASRARIRQVTLPAHWWLHENGPLLAFVSETAAPVALVPEGRGYRIEDPSGELSGRMDASKAELLAPTAYVLYRGFPELAITWRQIAGFALRSNWKDAILIFIMAMFVGLLGLVMPHATQLIFDYAIPGGLTDQLWQLGAGMFVAAIGTAAFSLVQGFLLLRVETKADRDVQSGVIDRLLRLPPPFFRRYSVGDLANRTMSVDAIRQIISSIGVTTLLGTVSALFNFFILFRYGWQLSLLAIGLGLIALLVTVSINLWSLRFARITEALEGSISGLVNQLIIGMAKLRVTGSAAHAFGVWAEKFAEKSRLHLRMRRIQNVLSIFNSAFPPITTLLIFWFAFQRITAESGGLSTGDFLAYSAAFGSFLGAVLAFSGATIQAIMVIPLYERAQPILQELPESGANQSWPGELSGDIDLRHVTFRYAADGPAVLQNINLTISPGEFVAVVGPSGGGKSTLLRLLLGFEKPETGAIYYNGQGLETLDRIEVRRQIGVVLQSSRPLSGDIFSNIASNSGATMDQAWAAAELAGFADDIRAMPMGMHTIVSEEGGGLSGGQRQRLMIARAVVNNPRILFFDEATSALDNETQAHVASGLAKLKATRLVIAHRLSTIAEADRIIVIRGGVIAEEGTFSALMEKRSFFYELAHRQLG